MGRMSDPLVFLDSASPEMQNAAESAQETFRFYWREMTWERRRIVPGLEVTAVKVGLADKGGGFVSKMLGKSTSAKRDEREYMWLGEIDFDGYRVKGTLQNEPNNIKGYRLGQQVDVALAEISDWLYAIGDTAYGGFTVDLIRQTMDADARTAHDAAWGLDFGAAGSVSLTPFDDDEAEHPMSENMGPQLEEALAANPSFATEASPDGSTLLHDMALGGSLASVDILLRHGADPTLTRADGATPLALAKVMNWPQVVRRLEAV